MVILVKYANYMIRSFLLLCFIIVNAVCYSQPAYVFHERGLEKFNNGDYAGALKDFETALQKDKNDFESYYDRGRTQEALGKPDLALTDYASSIKANPDYPHAYFSRANLLSKKNEEDAAIKDLTRVISLQPSYAPAFVARGVLYRKKKQNDNALADLNKAAGLKSKDADLFITRASILHEKGMIKEALTDLNAAIISIPGKHELYAKRASIYIGQNDCKSAIADLSKAIELRGGTEDVFSKRAACYANTGSHEASIKDYSHLLDVLKIKNADYYLNRAMQYRLKGDAPNALKDLTKYLGIKRDDPKALVERGIIYSTQGKSKHPLAATDFRKALELDKNLAEPHFYLGKMDFDAAKYETAVEHLGNYLKIKEDVEGYYLRSKAHYKLNHKKEMCADLSKAAQGGHKEAKKDFPVMCPN